VLLRLHGSVAASTSGNQCPHACRWAKLPPWLAGRIGLLISVIAFAPQVGQAASMASLLLAAGEPGHRRILPHRQAVLSDFYLFVCLSFLGDVCQREASPATAASCRTGEVEGQTLHSYLLGWQGWDKTLRLDRLFHLSILFSCVILYLPTAGVKATHKCAASLPLTTAA